MMLPRNNVQLNFKAGCKKRSMVSPDVNLAMQEEEQVRGFDKECEMETP